MVQICTNSIPVAHMSTIKVQHYRIGIEIHIVSHWDTSIDSTVKLCMCVQNYYTILHNAHFQYSKYFETRYVDLIRDHPDAPKMVGENGASLSTQLAQFAQNCTQRGLSAITAECHSQLDAKIHRHQFYRITVQQWCRFAQNRTQLHTRAQWRFDILGLA